MNIYIITDTHFGHTKVIEYCNRPENFEELISEELFKLTKDDLLIHLGDICICPDQASIHDKYIIPIGAKKILVRGNHDNKTNSWYQDHGWDFVCESFTNTYYRRRVTFSHKPIKDIENLNVHGHFHNSPKDLWDKEILRYLKKNHYLLSIENENYKPIEIKDLLNRIPRD